MDPLLAKALSRWCRISLCEFPTLKEDSCHQTCHARQTCKQTADNHRHVRKLVTLPEGRTSQLYGLWVALARKKILHSIRFLKTELNQAIEWSCSCCKRCVCERGNADSLQSLIIWIQMVGSPRGCAHFLKSGNPQDDHSEAFPCLKHQDVLLVKATTPWLSCLQRYFLLSHKLDCVSPEKLHYYLPRDSSSPWFSKKISISSLHPHTFLDLAIEKGLETHSSQADASVRKLTCSAAGKSLLRHVVTLLNITKAELLFAWTMLPTV